MREDFSPSSAPDKQASGGNDFYDSVDSIANFIFTRNDNNITLYKLAHATSSSGVSQSFDKAASLNSMVSGI